MTFQPIKKQTTVYEVVKQIEDSIISGELKIGSRLPSERQMAQLLEVSRPVVRESLIVLKGKGLINMIPGKGNFINDYRVNGSLPILESLISFQANNIDKKLIESLCATRKLIETETAYLAANNRKKEELDILIEINKEEHEILNKLKLNKLKDFRIENLVELDFKFHHEVAIASGNLVYPLLLNSFKKVYTFLTSSFFSSLIKNLNDTNLNGMEDFEFVIETHKKLIESIEKFDSKNSRKTMIKLLEHGERLLLRNSIKNLSIKRR